MFGYHIVSFYMFASDRLYMNMMCFEGSLAKFLLSLSRSKMSFFIALQFLSGLFKIAIFLGTPFFLF